jgi:ubiquinone/menaquinone biosynthesis C-methylase UbiE
MNITSASFSSNVKATVAKGYRQVAPGWHKWRQEFKTAGAAVTQAILRASHVKPGMRVLDVACGLGEPAFTLLPLVGPTGYVVGIDLVPEMLPSPPSSVNGAKLSNIMFGVADGEDLPFQDGTFDLVTCRGAVMHFPNAARALSETYRVLRPGGRAVLSALGPAQDTPAIMATIAIILRHSPSPPPDSALGPDVYRFGIPGTLSALFASAGFHNVHEERFTAPCTWPGNAKHFWEALPDHAWRVRELIERLPPDIRQSVSNEVHAALRLYEKDGMLHLTAPIVIASGKR